MIYVLHVQTGKEMAVRDELKQMYFGAMVPREISLERKGGAVIRRDRVLFSGYVFVDMAMNLQSYYKIKAMPHVIKFLGGGSPIQLTSAEARHIEWLTNGGKPLEPSELDEDGIVKTGPLKDRDKDVVAMNKRAKRAKLRITLAGEPHEISLSVTVAGNGGSDPGGEETAPSE